MQQCHGGSGSGFEFNGPGVVRWYYLGTAPSCWLLLKGTVLLSNAGHKTKLGEECLESSPAKRDVGVLVSSSSVWVSRVCPGTQRAKPHAGVHQAQHDQTTNRGDCPAALALGSSASVLCAVLDPTCQESKNKLLGCIQTRETKLVTGMKRVLRTSLERRRLEQRLPCSPWPSPWWHRLLPCSPWRTMAE